MKAQIQSLRILHFAFVMSQVLFGAVVFYLIQSAQMSSVIKDPALVNKIRPILIGIASGTIIGGFGLFQRSMKAIHFENASLQIKLQEYRKAAIIRYALIEVPSLLFIVFALLTADTKNLMYAAVVILILIITHPTVSGIAKQLKVTEDELA